MAKLMKVDFSQAGGGGGKIHVPPMDYAVTLKKIVQKVGSESNEPYWQASFELSKGSKKGNGKSLTHNFSLQPQATFNLRNFLEASGKTVPLKSVNIDRDKLVGLKAAATVIDEEYQGKLQSVISTFFPLSDLGKTSDGGDFGDDEEETPKKKKKADDDDEEEETPKKKKKKADDDEEESGEEEEEEKEEQEELF